MNDEIEIDSGLTFEIPSSLLVKTDKTETNSFINRQQKVYALLKFQMISPVSELSASTIRYVKRKYSAVIKNFETTLTKIILPDQEHEFLTLK